MRTLLPALLAIARSACGGAVGNGCGSTIRGAARATSEVTVRADRLATRDRGFAAGESGVWGAVDGPYVFLRVGAGSE